MPTSTVHLVPSMTVEQLAEFCEQHRCVVTVEASYDNYGRLMPRITVQDPPDYFIPDFLRKEFPND